MIWLNDRTVNHLRDLTALPDLSQTPYRIVRTLGSGGMAQVYLAEDTKLSRLVALKVTESLEATEEFAFRMQTEARVIARLEHPGIVPIHDVGTLPDGRVFYVMKRVQGESLEAFGKQEGSIQEKLRVFLKVCEAVAFAHEHGVIHRDLKPANIMIGAFGEVLVMDWGVAKLLPAQEEPISAAKDFHTRPPNSNFVDGASSRPIMDTASGTVLGTPSYMAPEQALGYTDQHSRQTDVYALGAILRYLLTGHHPFDGLSNSDPKELFKRKVAPRPRQAGPVIPRPLEAVCLKAMSVEPKSRYSGAVDLAADVEAFLDDLPVTAYREDVLEKSIRWYKRYRFIVWLLLAYTLVRFAIYFLHFR